MVLFKGTDLAPAGQCSILVQNRITIFWPIISYSRPIIKLQARLNDNIFIYSNIIMSSNWKNLTRRKGNKPKMVPATIVKKVNKLVRESKPTTKRNVAFPSYKKVTLKYAENIILSGILLQSNVYRMNSIFDPDFTGGGHQPYGRDQWANFYNRYRVESFSYRITATTNGVSNTILTVTPKNATAIAGNLTEAVETDLAKSKMLVGGPEEIQIISGKVNLAKFNGVSMDEYKSDDRFQALMSADPAEVMGLIISSGRADGTSASAFLLVELWYHVHLFDPIPLAQS